MQTSYSQAAAAARNGLLVYRESAVVVSKAVGVACRIGRFVARNAADDLAKPPVATGEVTATGFGFAVWDPGREPNTTDQSYTTDEVIPVGASLSVLRHGYIYVYSETAQAYGGAVFVRFTTATDGTDLGQIRNDADTAKAVALPRARIDETIGAAGIVRIYVEMAN